MNLYGVWLLRHLKVEGIVLYPFVLFHSKHPPLWILNHERIHWDQIKRDGIWIFYFRYLYEYFKFRKTGFTHDGAYRNISYEKEAFDHQDDKYYSVF